MRTQNTQGVEFKYIGDYIKVTQLNDKKSFKMDTIDNLNVLETLEFFLNSIDEIKQWSLVVNNTTKIVGYLVSIDVKGSSFLTLKDYL